jgi:hypothetical protein
VRPAALLELGDRIDHAPIIPGRELAL